MTRRRSASCISPKELFTFKIQAFIIFISCGFILQVWFALRGHYSLEQIKTWSEIVSTKTTYTGLHPDSTAERIKESLRQTNRAENLKLVASKHRVGNENLFLSKQNQKVVSKRNNLQGLGKTDETRNFKDGTEGLQLSLQRLQKSANITTYNTKTQHYKPKKNTRKKKGELLSMKWDELCCESINCLRKHPLFPLFPSEIHFLKTFRVANGEKLYAQRITGRLAPPKTGSYVFLVKCQGTCEMWLSEDGHSQKSIKLFAKVVHGLPVNFTKNKQDYTVELSRHRTYFIDVIFAIYRRVQRALQISWKPPDSEKFTVINEAFLAPIFDSLDGFLKVFAQSPSVRLTPFLESIEEAGEDDDEFKILGNNKEESGKFYDLDGNVVTVNRRSTELARNVLMSTNLPLSLKTCVPKTSNSSFRNISKYEGVWRTRFSSVFPRDNTGYMICIGNRYPFDCKGNKRISMDKVKKLLRLYNSALNGGNEKKEKKLKVTRIINIEQKKDSLKGFTYFLEVILANISSNSPLYDGRYLSMNKQGTLLCVPHESEFDRTATINIVIVVKSQARWLRHFLANMEKIYTTTNDNKLNIIIAYYGKGDAKLIKDFRSTRLPNIRTVRHFGKFNKPKAIQSAVNTIQDPRSIIFLMDLHIVVPVSMMSLVRKHTIQGKMVFNPVLFRLLRCASPRSYTKPPRGFWETFGYGILGIYKSDWDRIGGIGMVWDRIGGKNTATKAPKRGWGGEDWQLLDRILVAGLDVQRLRVPNFYHFYHSKQNMWN